MKLDDDLFNSIDFSASNLKQVDFSNETVIDEVEAETAEDAGSGLQLKADEEAGSGFQLKSDDNEGSGLRLKVDDSVNQEIATSVDNRGIDEYGVVGQNENYIGTGDVKSTGDVYLDAQIDGMLNNYYNGTSPDEPSEKEMNSTRMKGYFFILLAAIFMIFGLSVLGKIISTKRVMATGEEMLVTISKVEKHKRYRRRHTTTTYHVYVSYTVNGLKYENIYLDSFWAEKKVGGTILVYYDPDKPYEVHSPQSVGIKNISTLVIIGIACVALCFYGWYHIRDPRKAYMEGKRFERANMRRMTDSDLRRIRSGRDFWNPRNPWNRL